MGEGENGRKDSREGRSGEGMWRRVDEERRDIKRRRRRRVVVGGGGKGGERGKRVAGS